MPRMHKMRHAHTPQRADATPQPRPPHASPHGPTATMTSYQLTMHAQHAWSAGCDANRHKSTVRPRGLVHVASRLGCEQGRASDRRGRIEAAPSACCEVWNTRIALPQIAAAAASHTRTVRSFGPRGRSTNEQRVRHTSELSVFTMTQYCTTRSRTRQCADDQAGTPRWNTISNRLRIPRISIFAPERQAACSGRQLICGSGLQNMETGGTHANLAHDDARVVGKSVCARSSCTHRERHSSTQRQSAQMKLSRTR